jgi:Zn-dependent peptidase ImmA (M78 family)/transcriptional regulator with XRE-family HTH domain
MTQRPNPEILSIARDSRDESQEAVAKAAGVTQGMISKAENGVVDLSDEQVDRIAAFLRYPAALFYEPGRARSVGSACLYHRKRKTLPKRVLKALNARMELRLISTRRLLRDLDLDAERMFHTMDPDEYKGSPVEVARALRRAWRIPDGPTPNMTALIESAGGVVIQSDFGTHKLMGMSCWERNAQPLFLLNSRMSTADLRWTLAHELGHLTMHGVPPTGDPEEQADAFAGEFLAPRSLIVPALRRLTFDRLYPLKMTWRLSIKALIVRAQRTGSIDTDAATRLFKQYSARGFNTEEPYPLSPEPPTLVSSAIDIHLREHGYTAGELATQVVYLYRDEFTEELMGGKVYPDDNVVSLFPPESFQRT